MELLEFKRSAETCPKSGLHNPIKNPERYFMYGEICHKAAYLLGHPLIEDYFITGTITLTNYSNPTKYNAFLAQANTLVEGLGVIIEITQDVHQAGNNPSTFTITILKGTQIITTTITVNYSK